MLRGKRLLCVASVLFLALAAEAQVQADSTVGTFQATSDLSNTPNYYWWYGCSPTSAGMMMAYYDISGYNGLSFSNLTPGAEMSTYPSTAGVWQYNAQNYIASSNGRSVAAYNNGGSTNVTVQNSLADFMGTSLAKYGNGLGSSTFEYWTNGKPWYIGNDVTNGYTGSGSTLDALFGMWEYFQSRGYGGSDPGNSFFTQLIYSASAPNGYTFSDYENAIKSGLVVMIQLYTQGVGGHSMFGFGYQIANGHDYVDVYDTWDDQKETMLWGGTYGPSPTEQMQMIAVTEFIPTGGSPVPLPSTALLLAPGLISLAVMRKRLKS